jgi:hypothetical protein
MTKTPVTLLLVLFTGRAAGPVEPGFVAPARAQGQAGPNFEYEAVEVANSGDNDRKALAQFGRERWRPVSRRTLYSERRAPPGN